MPGTPKIMTLTRRGDCITTEPEKLEVSQSQNDSIQIVAGGDSSGPITLTFNNAPKLGRIFEAAPPEKVVLHPDPSHPSVAGLNAQKEITLKVKSKITFSSGARMKKRSDGSKAFSDGFEPHAVTYSFGHDPDKDCHPHNHEDWHIEC